jgi:hypothetical protein
VKGDLRPARLLGALALRLGGGPLRPILLACYRALIAAVAAILRGGRRETAVYVRGSFGGAGSPVPGVSDVDLALVVPDGAGPAGHAHRASIERWEWVVRRVPPLGRVVAIGAYEEGKLADAARSSALTYDLDTSSGTDARRALFAGGGAAGIHLAARFWRPGVPVPLADWRLVAGPDRRPSREHPEDDQPAVAWLELQCWWRYAFWAAAAPEEPHVAYLGVKLVAEPLRVLLWLRDGESIVSRREALRVGLRRVSEEEDAIRAALRTYDRLARGPDPELDERLACLLRLSRAVAREVRRRADVAGPATEVALVGETALGPGGGRGGLAVGRVVPLADWRARTVPGEPPERLLELRGSADSPGVLAAAAAAERPGEVPAVRAREVLVEPTLDRSSRPLLRGVLRAIQCEASDPVSFALLEGRRDASFPALPGWSAADCARRGVAEHAARLADGGCGVVELLAAARSALFLQAVERGEPRLAVDLAAVCDELEREPDAGPAAVAAREALEAGAARHDAPEALERTVRALPAFARRPVA